MPPSLPRARPSFAARVRRIIRRGFLTLAIVLIGGCVAENYRGHYVWRIVLDELRAASVRPYSTFPVHYEEHVYAQLPHLPTLKRICSCPPSRVPPYVSRAAKPE